ncbi:hypothetical protein LJR168_003748 [Pseudoxanthomonas sp. LjRoot168]
MGSYEQAAWYDAIRMARHVADDFAESKGISIRAIHRRFEAFSVEQIREFDSKYWHLIGEYVSKTESQRPAYFRKVAGKVGTDEQIMFLVLCVLAALRAGRLLELRDQYRLVLAPGSGNRATAAGAYRFLMETQALFDYSWPHDAFTEAGYYAPDFEEDE